ncbi:S8 family peptidase [Massilia litorea]|uniref:S8 family serine peptidase n=1 Tax=Massilia litorea TaxID=2769491 RepID=A0A7L9U1W9_9BURK|nr:S8 family serine peptidase [Massilia litorea]QOL48272.1 S8 family serine peptidase [Massilia litorea]
MIRTGIAALVLGLCTLLGPAQRCAAQAADEDAQPAPPAAARDAEPAARQLLVMLRLPPRHFRPDSAYGSGYGGDGTRAARRRLAEELAGAHGLKLVNAWPMPAIGVDCFVMEEAGGVPVERALAELARDPRVLWVQPVSQYEGLDGGDPLYAVQPAGRDWQLAALHRASTGRRVPVAVIDSGVDSAHPDLLGQVALRENFVDTGPDAAEAHGTAVAGIIAARSGNGVGIAGIAPDARLMALRACWERPHAPVRCNSFTLGRAINYALLHGARVINLSLSGPPDRLLQSLLDAALARGIAVVGAADPRRADGGFPASHPGVISVAAAGTGAAPGALHAPGADIPTCMPGARWALVNGSSFAAAHVSGLAALLVELRPALTPAGLRSRLSEAGAGVAAFSLNTRQEPGQQAERTGSIDACAVIGRAAGACVCPCPSTVAITAEKAP